MQFIGISTFQVHKLLWKKKYWKKMLTLSDLKVTCLKEKKNDLSWGKDRNWIPKLAQRISSGPLVHI